MLHSPLILCIYRIIVKRSQKAEEKAGGRRQEAEGFYAEGRRQKAEVKKLQTSDLRLKTFSPTPYTLHHTPNKTPNP
jgi:hypothetical protein